MSYDFAGGQRIAMHYKFSISKAFEVLKDAPAIIVVEDDLLFSPDFYEYFESVAPILEADPTTFVISAWNDKYVIDQTWNFQEENGNLFRCYDCLLSFSSLFKCYLLSLY